MLEVGIKGRYFETWEFTDVGSTYARWYARVLKAGSCSVAPSRDALVYSE